MSVTRTDSGRISRRHLIRSGAAATLLAASSLAGRAEPARHGVLRLAAPGAVSGAAPDPFGRLVAPGSVFDCLTEIGPDGRLHGELAQSWEPRDGARQWTITLREEVRFHDGRAFAAEDAVASLRLHMARAPDALGIASVRKAGPRQILIALDAPDPGLPFLLSDPLLVMLPADAPDAALLAGIGTGLYRVSDTPAAESLRLERVAEHYKDGRAGWFAAVELLRITDPAERTAALMAGRVDAIAAPDGAALKRAGHGGRPVSVSVPSGSHLRITARGPAADALAGALKAGLDRADLLSAFLGGEGRIAADHPLVPDATPAHDPDLARHLLARAGVDRATVGLGAGLAGAPGLDGLVRSLRGFAAGAGLDLAAGETPDLLVTLAPAQPTDDLALRRFDFAGVRDPEALHRRLAEARRAADSALRREIHAEVARVLAREGRTHVPVFANARFAHSARLSHLGHIGALDMLDSGRVAERWFYGSYG